MAWGYNVIRSLLA